MLQKVLINNKEVQYDDTVFEYFDGIMGLSGHLHYIGDGIRPVINPKNNTLCLSMFEGFSGVTLNLTGFDTSEVTDMSSMFRDCTNLKFLDLSSFNTSNVLDMTGMFMNCKSLISLNLSNFVSNPNANADGMFLNCTSLKWLNILEWDISPLRGKPVFRGISPDCKVASVLPNFIELYEACYGTLKKTEPPKVEKESIKKEEKVTKEVSQPTMGTPETTFNKPIKSAKEALKEKELQDTRLQDIITEIRNLINEGKSEKEVYTTIKNRGVPQVDIMRSFAEVAPHSRIVEAFVTNVVIPDVSTLFKTVNGRSLYTVGEIVDKLIKKHPENLVYKAICVVLKDQILID